MERYIERLEVRGLWNLYDLTWELRPGVNILAGSNGSGKSTVLRCLSGMFTRGKVSASDHSRIQSIVIRFSDGSCVDSGHPFDPEKYNVSVISTFDTSLPASEAVYKLSDGKVSTYLDWELYRLQNRYLSYQLEVGRQVIAALQAGKDQKEITELTDLKVRFCDIIDSLFEPTGKTMDRNSDTLQFRMKDGRTILPHQLSSGEKQILIILTTVLVQGGRDLIMLMDEPEISLHFDWQRRLIEDILSLSPRVQLILATHSPAVVMEGWTDRVSEIGDLVHPLENPAAPEIRP